MHSYSAGETCCDESLDSGRRRPEVHEDRLPEIAIGCEAQSHSYLYCKNMVGTGTSEDYNDDDAHRT